MAGKIWSLPGRGGASELMGVNPEVRAIEEFFRRRLKREALYLPSGRLALYLAFREWLRPGDRLLMSPVNDDVVFFTVLAAGLVPVLAPLDPSTGNIDPAGVDDSTWVRLRGVMTTNLYGIPDRMDLLEARCRRHGLVLVEDACHALDSRCGGRRIGEFGTAAAYSMTKHLGTVGGVLTFSEAGRRQSLMQRAREETHSRVVIQTVARTARTLLHAAGTSTALRRRVAGFLDRLVPRLQERCGHRMPYRTADVRDAQQAGAGLMRFDRWVRMDNPAYRSWPPRPSVHETLRRLESFEAHRRLRLEGVGRLLAFGLTPAGVRLPADTALLRVPLFVQERDGVIAHLRQHGLAVEYIYDPPLDLYAPELAELLPSSPAARIWSRHVLPVDPLHAERFLAVLREAPRGCVAAPWAPSPVAEAVHLCR